MLLLIIIPRQERTTGNWITASRLQQGLVALGHHAGIIETDGAAEELRAAVTAAAPQLVLLLHAWRSGRPWLETQLSLPYAVLLTGTDVNLGLHDPQQAPGIMTVLERAAAIFSQNALTVAELQGTHPQLAARLHHLPPGIVLGTAPFPLRARLGAAPAEPVLLCPAGIRPVKGVVELIDACAPLRDEDFSLRLAFCGPLLDRTYAERFLDRIARTPWASWLGTIPPEAMPDAMRHADLIVSYAFSEGLPNALVEAVALGRPVVARAIPGNQAVVTDGVNGLLFADAAGFRAAVRRLLLDPELRAALSVPAPQRFSAHDEAGALAAICQTILTEPSQA
ncbi:MAG: glycosyltransferase [Gemmatimonadales bacterium]|nr:MAG: glycosyltransferase [Gemmatimonadales bacterium]